MSRAAGIIACAAIAALFMFGTLSTSAYAAEDAQPAPKAENAAPQPQTPKLVATPDSFDFGEINEGDKPKAVFTLKNEGGAKLVIYDAKPSCGCTLAKLSSKEIMPGEQATLEAVYNSTNAHGGNVSKYVNVKTNDPSSPTKVLRIVGKVIAKPAPMLTLNPYRADRLVIKTGESEKRQVKLINNGQLDLHITEITTSRGLSAKLDEFDISPAKTIKMEFVIKPGETRSMDVNIAPDAKPGAFQETVTIRSDAKGRPATVFVASGVLQ